MCCFDQTNWWHAIATPWSISLLKNMLKCFSLLCNVTMLMKKMADQIAGLKECLGAKLTM